MKLMSGLFLSPTTVQWWVAVRIEDYGLKGATPRITVDGIGQVVYSNTHKLFLSADVTLSIISNFLPHQ